MDLFSVLHRQNELTASEKNIVEFVIANKEACTMMSTKEFAQKSHSSHAGVIRWCQKIGFNNFQEFQQALIQTLQKEKQQKKRQLAKMPHLNTTKKIRNGSIDVLYETMDALQEEQLSQAVFYLARAERIFLFATSDMQLQARSLVKKLNQINRCAILADEYGEAKYLLRQMSSKDCVIFFFSHHQAALQSKKAQYLKNKQVPTILFAPHSKNETQKMYAVRFSLPKFFNPIQKKACVSTVGAELIFEVLCTLLAPKAKKRAPQTKKPKKKEFTFRNGRLVDEKNFY